RWLRVGLRLGQGLRLSRGYGCRLGLWPWLRQQQQALQCRHDVSRMRNEPRSGAAVAEPHLDLDATLVLVKPHAGTGVRVVAAREGPAHSAGQLGKATEQGGIGLDLQRPAMPRGSLELCAGWTRAPNHGGQDRVAHHAAQAADRRHSCIVPRKANPYAKCAKSQKTASTPTLGMVRGPTSPRSHSVV